jgi:hypothetical protein
VLPKSPDISGTLSPDSLVWRLSDLFTNLDLAQLSVLHDDEVLPVMHVEPWQDTSVHPGPLSKGIQ